MEQDEVELDVREGDAFDLPEVTQMERHTLIKIPTADTHESPTRAPGKAPWVRLRLQGKYSWLIALSIFIIAVWAFQFVLCNFLCKRTIIEQWTEHRKIVILLDGTGNDRASPDHPPTNVARIAGLLRSTADPSQLIMYNRGVATSNEHALGVAKMWSFAVGKGIGQIVEDVYMWLMDNYKETDTIYILGYSRGATAARALAGLLDQHGIYRTLKESQDAAREFLTRGTDEEEEATTTEKNEKEKKEENKEEDEGDEADVLQIDADPFDKPLNVANATPATPPAPIPIENTKAVRHVPIEFLGVFDTVDTTGFHFHLDDFPTNVKVAYHALAIDERRKHFQPVLFADKRATEVWFAGVHSNVGGGASVGHVLSDVTLHWMVNNIQRHALNISNIQLDTSDLEDSTSEIKQGWDNFLARLMGELKPRHIPEGSNVHYSVKQMMEDSSYKPENLPTNYTVVKD
eukprot:TRINITY_DN96703_c0_g1_i1.p1 TRINITY_DN96703_c0_g1~~TRINITY_DN96703_c0_g1_i1.p1  ORF type:complete len:461 (-),score=38.52 TRINITY_DN96703_c0_g1_i1:40-1422(-)